MKPPISLADIDRLHRVGKPTHGKNRPVLVKFATYRARQAVYSYRMALGPPRKDGRPRSPTHPWGIPATDIPDGSTTQSGEETGPKRAPKAASDASRASQEEDRDDGTDAERASPENRASEEGATPGPDGTPRDTRDRARATEKITSPAFLFDASLRVFINEDLTRKRASLLYEARQAVHGKYITGCWSHDGAIRIKTNNNLIQTITSLQDLQLHVNAR